MVIVDFLITTHRYLLDINVISELGGNSFGIDYTLKNKKMDKEHFIHVEMGNLTIS